MSNSKRNKDMVRVFAVVPGVDPTLQEAIELSKGVLIQSINDITNLTGYLDLSNYTLNSLQGIEYATNIGQLYLNNTTIANIDLLENLQQLTWLEFTDNNIVDITPIANLINLIGLKINNNPITNLVSLANLQKLKVLRMRKISNELTIDKLKLLGISQLKNIKVLDLGENGINSIVDSTGNSLIPNLQEVLSLGLEENNIQIIDILKNLKNISYLDLSANKITDITPLENNTALQVLYLNSNLISNPEIISSLHGVQELYLDNMGITDINFLANNRQLERLSIKGNYIKDLTPLQELKSLFILYLDNNKVQTIEALQKLIKLEEVTLDNNFVANLYYLSGTPISKIPFNKIKANNQSVITPPPEIDNGELTLSLSNVIWDVDKSVPKNIKNESVGSMSISNNIITWSNISANYNLSFQFSNGTYTTANGGTAIGAYFTGTVILANIISFPDINLEKKLLQVLNMSPNTPITDKDLQTIITLDLSGSNISNLSSLEYAINLRELNINGNSILDLSPIFNLSKLSEVKASEQNIEYPIQTISYNGELIVSLDLLGSGANNYDVILSDISDNGYQQGNYVVWEKLTGNPTLKFTYRVVYYTNDLNDGNLTPIDIIVSGYATILTVRENDQRKINRGINIFK